MIQQSGDAIPMGNESSDLVESMTLGSNFNSEGATWRKNNSIAVSNRSQRPKIVTRKSTHTVFWVDDDDDDADPEHSATPASIPSWSKQDRFKRAVIIPKLLLDLFGSSLFLGLLYFIVCLIPGAFRDQTEATRRHNVIITMVFIVLQTFATLLSAIPREDTTNTELNLKIDSSILIAMTLYPCLGLWFGTRPTDIPFGEFFIGDMNNLWELRSKSESYQWGSIFPFFFWSTSAFIFIRESNYSFTMDRAGVVSDEDGKAMTALFRRYPSFQEKFLHKVTRYLTFSLWSILPSKHRPAGGAGRFAFQLVAPFVIVFFYVGGRFMLFATHSMYHVISNPNDYTRHCLEKGSLGEKRIHELIQVVEARFYVWIAFCMYCIIIRAIVGSRLFLSRVIHDPQSLKDRWVGWSEAIVESKRRRVLWAFRGLAVATCPFYIIKSDCSRPQNVFDWAMYYLYFAVYVSFFCEGAGAVFFGLSEAQKGCQLTTPFELFTDLWFWSAFNAYLQPTGTVINVIFWATNKEYLKKLRMREIWGPALLTNENIFRFKLPKFLRRKTKKLTQEELDEILEEWIETWRRKRLGAGRDTSNIVIKKKEETYIKGKMAFIGDVVFHGTMFPSYDEWIYMRDHHDQFIPLLPWEQYFGTEKFLKWYPTYREDIISLLSEPYDFETQRTVWMFGYGSLISPDCPPHGLSDDQRKQIIPYWLKKQAGYRRVWNYRHGSVGINAFGLEEIGDVENEGMNICGCLYPMDYEKASDLFSFREEGYELLLIDADYFEPMHPDFQKPEGVGYVWVCGQPILKSEDPFNNMESKRHYPTEDSPILQSYIDTVLEGALRYSTAGIGHVDGMNFAAAIISSTAGWDYPWYNDRLLAGRPWTYFPNYELIDGLLSTCPLSRDAFVKRRRTSMEIMSLKTTMLEKEKQKTMQWGNNYFRKLSSYKVSSNNSSDINTSSKVSGKRSTYININSPKHSSRSSYADRQFQHAIQGCGKRESLTNRHSVADISSVLERVSEEETIFQSLKL